MKICVLVKEVPDAAVEKRINPSTGRLDRGGEKNLNPFDTHAIEAAMQLKEGGAIDIDAESGNFARRYVAANDGAHAEEVGMLAALVADPQVLAAVRDRHETWQDRVANEGGDPVDATVARLAADGLWLADLLGTAPPRGQLRERVLARLLELCD